MRELSRLFFMRLLYQVFGFKSEGAIDLNEMHMKQKFEEEVARLNKFQKTFFGAKKMAKSNAKQINLRDYAEYVLREGAVAEKREFLGCVKSRFTLANKTVKIQK